MHIQNNITANVLNSHFANHAATAYAVFSATTAHYYFRNCTFFNNTALHPTGLADGVGAAIASFGGNLTIESSLFSGHVANQGGAIYHQSQGGVTIYATIRNSVVERSAVGVGAVSFIAVNGKINILIEGSMFNRNIANATYADTATGTYSGACIYVSRTYKTAAACLVLVLLFNLTFVIARS
jgi:hypothetical protein